MPLSERSNQANRRRFDKYPFWVNETVERDGRIGEFGVVVFATLSFTLRAQELTSFFPYHSHLGTCFNHSLVVSSFSLVLS